MNIQPVWPPDRHGLYVVCHGCLLILPMARAFADLDGEPFAAYYCSPCAKEKVTE